MENGFPTLTEAIAQLFLYRGSEGERELTAGEVQACADWLNEHRPGLAQTLQEVALLFRRLGQHPPRLSLAALGNQRTDLIRTAVGDLLDLGELLHEREPEAWTWEAWSANHADHLLRLLLLVLLQLDRSSRAAIKKLRTEFPWPEGLHKPWRSGS